MQAEAKPLRATRDPVVIAAWEQAVSDYKTKYGKLKPALMIAMLVCFVLFLFFQSPLLVFLFFALIPALIAAGMFERHALICPHCSRSPVSSFSRDSPLDLDFCRHCRYWLRPPF